MQSWRSVCSDSTLALPKHFHTVFNFHWLSQCCLSASMCVSNASCEGDSFASSLSDVCLNIVSFIASWQPLSLQSLSSCGPSFHRFEFRFPVFRFVLGAEIPPERLRVQRSPRDSESEHRTEFSSSRAQLRYHLQPWLLTLEKL